MPGDVRAACARCHAFPEPGVLPRGIWHQVIDDMLALPEVKGISPLTDEEADIAKAYYLAKSPERLVLRKKSVTKTKLEFVKREFTPPDLEKVRLPAVSNVQFDGADLIVSELRSRKVFRLSGGSFSVLAPNANYPVAVEQIDGDRLIVGMGGMHPTEETRGSLILASSGTSILKNLPRPTGVGAADFDGDGDLDYAVAAFGWRSSGGLLLVEADGENHAVRELDPRDGFVQVAIADIDGDGRKDIVGLVAQEHEALVAFLNHGSMEFTRRELYRAPHPSWAFTGMQVVDFDGDGDADILASNGDSLDYNVPKPYSGVQWFENDGQGKFTPRVVGALVGCSQAVASDIDGDGDLDVAAVAFMPLFTPEEWEEQDLASVAWFERDGTDWKRHVVERHNACHPTVDVGNFDGDGKADLAVGNYVWLDEKSGKALARREAVSFFVQRESPMLNQ